ncbi:hypothetical protein PHMEG_00039763, partial [Phytophthora megakarya]
MEAERDREREVAKNIQKFQASQLRDLRATSAQVQYATVTPVPDAVSRKKTESGIANFQQDAKGQDAEKVAVKKEKSADKEAQPPARTFSWPHNSRLPSGASAPKSSDDAKAMAKKATPKARASRKARRGGYPSDPDPSTEDDDSDSSSDDSDSSFCEPLSDMVVPKATQRHHHDDYDREFSGYSDPLDFLYRLNDAADRADIRYKKSEQRHVKRFTHRLAGSQLKSILKSQRFKSMDDLENVLRQQEDDERLQGGQPPGDESEADERHVIFDDEVPESASTQESI